MAESVIEHSSCAVGLGIDRRHFAGVSYVRAIDARKREVAGRKDIYAWINVEVVLLGDDFEVRHSGGDFVGVRLIDVDGIADSIVTRVSDPL